MRKLATLAALTLSTGTALLGAASTASADINLGNLGNGTPAPAAGSMDFANHWCGAPWLWSSRQDGAACDAAHRGGAGR